MQDWLKPLAVTLAVGCALLGVVHAPALAQSVTTASDIVVEKLQVTWSTKSPNKQSLREAFKQPGGMPAVADSVWNTLRDPLGSNLAQQLNQRTFSVSGASAVLSNVSCALAAQATTKIEPVDSTGRLVLELPGNSLAMTVSILGLSQRVTGLCDVRIRCALLVQSPAGRLTVGPCTSEVTNVQFAGGGSLGPSLQQLGTALAPFIASRINEYPELPTDINARLAPLNAQLQAATGNRLLRQWWRFPTLVAAFAPIDYPGWVVLPTPPLAVDYDPVWFKLPARR